MRNQIWTLYSQLITRINLVKFYHEINEKLTTVINTLDNYLLEINLNKKNHNVQYHIISLVRFWNSKYYITFKVSLLISGTGSLEQLCMRIWKSIYFYLENEWTEILKATAYFAIFSSSKFFIITSKKQNLRTWEQ